MKSKQKKNTGLSPEMWLLVLAALPFIIIYWYIEGRYEKKEQLEEVAE